MGGLCGRMRYFLLEHLAKIYFNAAQIHRQGLSVELYILTWIIREKFLKVL